MTNSVRVRAPLVTLLAALFASCGGPTQEASQAPAPVAGEMVQDWIEDLPGALGQVIYIRNDGTVPVVVRTVRLTRCDNTRQPCGDHQPNAVVAPGATVVLMRITPLDEFKPFSFQYTYQWRTHQ
jgi:hypothetical protein